MAFSPTAFRYYFFNLIRSLTVKTRLELLILSLMVLSSSVMSQTPGPSPQTIRVVMDNAYAPYSFQSNDGKLQGILIDQWQAWEKKTGIKVEIQSMDWGEAVRRTRAGEFDVIDSIVETAERRAYFDFTPPYTTIEASIYFRTDISGITDLASLKGFPVGVKTGDQHIDQLKANGVTTVIPFQSNDAIIEAAKQHKINVFVVDDPSALYLLNKTGIEEDFRHSAPVFRDELRRAVRKGDAATLRAVTEGFAAVEPGELKRIDEKWFGRTINGYGRYLSYAGYAAAAAILLITGLVGWNRTLRKRIAQRTAALGESEQRFREIAENIREVFWMSTGDFDSPHFAILYISPAYESVWGRTRESLYRDPHTFIDAIHPEDRARVAEANERDYERGFDIEYRLVRPDGSMRWIRDRGFPIKDAAGRFYRLTGIAEDITERKQAEAALAERLRFETLVTELSAAFANVSPNEVDHEIDKWLQTLVEFLGVDRATFFQFDEDWTTLYRSHSYTVPGIEPLPPPPVGLKDQFPWIMDQLLKGVTVKWSRIPDDMPEEAAEEKQYAAKVGVKSGLNIPVLASGSVICAISFTSIAAYRDWPDEMVARLRLVGEIFAAVVERKRAEERVRATTEQLRALSARLQSAREEEGTRIAREIHDELGAALSSLRWDLEGFDEDVCEVANRPQLQELRQKIATMMRLTDTTISTVRRIASELRPFALDEVGLTEAIEWQARQFQDRTGIIVQCDSTLENDILNREQSTTAFRISQEALTNILRHAQATRVNIQMKEENGEFILTIGDNGRGLTEGEKSGQRTLGLLGMRERAHLVGGRIDITRSEGKGTGVTLRFPIISARRIFEAGN